MIYGGALEFARLKRRSYRFETGITSAAMINPNTKRSQSLRARRKAQGLTEVRGIWAPTDDHASIKAKCVWFMRGAIKRQA